MKSLVSTLACASLLAAPLAASPNLANAQTHQGGFHGAAAARGGSGFRSSGFRGGSGFHGGFRGRGFRGGFGGAPFFFGGAFLGFALGAALADSWYYDYPVYYGYYAPYGVAPPPYDDPWADDYGPPPASEAQPPRACGSWSWDAARSKYNWIPCANAPA